MICGISRKSVRKRGDIVGSELIVLQSALDALDKFALCLQRCGQHERALGLYDAIEALQKLNVYEVITVKGKYLMQRFTYGNMFEECKEAHAKQLISTIGNVARENGCVDIEENTVKLRGNEVTEISIRCNVIRKKEPVFILPKERGDADDYSGIRRELA